MRMIVIGIVGGIASGKSLVTQQLESLGAITIHVDRIGHEVLLDQQVRRSVRQRWGDAVFDSSGNVHRPRLAEIVFDPANPNELEELERLTHPLIEERLRNHLDRLRSEEKSQVVVVDAPVMVKTGWYRLCDQIIFVEASLENRIKRAMARGWSKETLAQREAAQTPISDKRSISSFQVDNNHTPAETLQQIKQIWTQLADRSEATGL